MQAVTAPMAIQSASGTQGGTPAPYSMALPEQLSRSGSAVDDLQRLLKRSAPPRVKPTRVKGIGAATPKTCSRRSKVFSLQRTCRSSTTICIPHAPQRFRSMRLRLDGKSRLYLTRRSIPIFPAKSGHSPCQTCTTLPGTVEWHSSDRIDFKVRCAHYAHP